MKKLRRKKVTLGKITSALRSGALQTELDALSTTELCELSDRLWKTTYFSFGTPSRWKIQGIQRDLPLVAKVVDFDAVQKRREKLVEPSRFQYQCL